MEIEKIKIPGAVLEHPSKQHCWYGQFGPILRWMGWIGRFPDWRCCLAGNSKTAPRIFICSIVLGAEYLSYVKFIATFALTLFGYIISVLASVVDLELLLLPY